MHPRVCNTSTFMLVSHVHLCLSHKYIYVNLTVGQATKQVVRLANACKILAICSV